MIFYKFYWKLLKNEAPDFKWAALQLALKSKKVPSKDAIRLISVRVDEIMVEFSDQKTDEGDLIEQVVIKVKGGTQEALRKIKKPPPAAKTRFEREDLV